MRLLLATNISLKVTLELIDSVLNLVWFCCYCLNSRIHGEIVHCQVKAGCQLVFIFPWKDLKIDFLYSTTMSSVFTRSCKERRIASVLSSSFFCLIFWKYLLIPTKSGKNVNCWLGRDEQIRASPPLALCNSYLMMPVVIYSEVFLCNIRCSFSTCCFFLSFLLVCDIEP